MKNIILILLLSLVAFSGCRKEDGPILGDPDARLTAKLEEYAGVLTSASNGWKVFTYPGAGGGYSFYMTFDNKNAVKMFSDISLTSGSVENSSTYRLKALQLPSLLFDTYNYLSLLSDPNSDVLGGVKNEGFKADIEYGVLSSADTVVLRGVKYKSPMYLVKATPAEATAYKAGALRTSLQTHTSYFAANPYPYIEFADGVKAQWSLNGKNVIFSYVDAKDEVVTLNAAYYYTITGLALKDPIIYGNGSFKEILWDATQSRYYVMINNQRVDIKNSTFPLVPFYLRFGFAKTYSQFTVNPATTTGLSAAFLTIYNNTKTGLAAVGNAGRVLDYFYIRFTGAEEMTLRFYYHNTANTAFQANYIYKITWIEKNKVRFTRLSRDGNADVVGGVGTGGLTALTNYLEQNDFIIDWANNLTPGSTALMGGLTVATDPTSSFFGALVK